MINPNKLKAAKENTTHYPNRAAVKCDIINTDNSIFETELLKEEVDLAIYLKSIFKKLKQSEKTKLLELIEKFGDMCYENGEFDSTYQG